MEENAKLTILEEYSNEYDENNRIVHHKGTDGEYWKKYYEDGTIASSKMIDREGITTIDEYNQCGSVVYHKKYKMEDL